LRIAHARVSKRFPSGFNQFSHIVGMASPRLRTNVPAAAIAAASARSLQPAAIGAAAALANSHVIWGSVDANPDSSAATSDSWPVFSGQVENVTFRDWSGSSKESLSQSKSFQSVAALLDSDKAPEARALLTRDGWWSAGSEKHTDGMCRPCHYVHAARGCKDGKDCSFCHLPHVQSSNRSRNRPCKTKREQCKKILGLVASVAGGGNNEQVQQVVQNVTCQSSYMQNMLLKCPQSPGQDQQPILREEHNPTVETGNQPELQQTAASSSTGDGATSLLQMVQVPSNVHHFGESGHGLPKASPLPLSSHERRRSLVSL